MLTCELSGQVTVHPVITSCHHVFEKNLIEDYIANSGCCPKCNTQLTTQDLYPINITPLETYPSTIRAPSFGSLLSSLQNEWDAVQVELFNLRKSLAQAQRELAQALYENDAAKRVIARLLSEQGIAIPSEIGNNNFPSKTSNLATFFEKEAKAIDKRNKSKEKRKNDINSIFDAFTRYSLSRQGPILNGESKLSTIDRFPQREILVGAANGLILGIDPLHGISHEYASFDNEVISLVSNPSFTQFIAADKLGNIKVCAITNSESKNEFSNLAFNEIKLATQRPIVSALFHPLEQHVIVSYASGTIEVFAVNQSDPEHPSLDSFLTLDAQIEITAAELHSNGRYLFVANGASERLFVFDVANKQLIDSEFVMPSPVTAIALPRNNSRFVAAGCASCARVWDLGSHDVVAEIEGDCVSLAFDDSGFLLAVIGSGGNKCKFVKLNELESSSAPVHDVDINSNSRMGKFSSNRNYFAIIGDNDCIDFISSQE